MVRLARGAMMPNRGRGRGRPGPMLNPREHMMGLRSHDIRPGFGPPLPPPPPRGPMGLPRRMPPAPIPPPMLPRPPLHMRPGFPPPPRAPLGRRPFPLGPPCLLPLPMRPLPPPPPPPLVMARGGLMRRPGLRPGMGGLKRLGTAANGRIKRTQKRKPKLKEKSEGEFYCDTCDRGWKTQEELIKHQSEHETCGRDGCTFQAHPKIVEKHIQLQHLTGLYKRITFSYDPEEIHKWRAERKRRFPTAENIEKNRQQKEEMMKRGERIETEKGFGRNGRKMRHMGGQNRHKKMRSQTHRHHMHRRQTQERREEKPVGSSVKEYDPDSWRGKLPMFPGTGAFPEIRVEVTSEAVDSYFSDDEWEMDATCEPEFKEPAIVSSALCALMGNYGSDVSDHEDNRESESARQQPLSNKIHPSKNSNVSTKTIINQMNTDTSKPEVAVTQTKIESVEPLQVITGEIVHVEAETNDDIGPEEVKIQREPPAVGTVLNKQPNVDKQNTGNSNRASYSKENHKNKFKKPVPTVRQPIHHPMYRRKRFTLLEKLLSNEIRHERNVILQCVRYVVENNFFGGGPPKKEEETLDNTVKSEAT